MKSPLNHHVPNHHPAYWLIFQSTGDTPLTCCRFHHGDLTMSAVSRPARSKGFLGGMFQSQILGSGYSNKSSKWSQEWNLNGDIPEIFWECCDVKWWYQTWNHGHMRQRSSTPSWKDFPASFLELLYSNETNVQDVSIRQPRNPSIQAAYRSKRVSCSKEFPMLSMLLFMTTRVWAAAGVAWHGRNYV
jgi:hypothetical protein